MASNLFLLKGWMVTLIAALFALAAKGSKDFYFLLAYFPTFMFWIIDSEVDRRKHGVPPMCDRSRRL